MIDQFVLVVEGKPEPAGSKKHVGGHRIVDANDNVGDWKTRVAREARKARDGREPLTGPLELRVDFYLRRPKSHYGTGRNEGKLKPTAPDQPTTAPDTTKLVRAVEDALTGIFYLDDAQVVDQYARKFYSVSPRVMVTVKTVPPQIVPPIQW